MDLGGKVLMRVSSFWNRDRADVVLAERSGALVLGPGWSDYLKAAVDVFRADALGGGNNWRRGPLSPC